MSDHPINPAPVLCSRCRCELSLPERAAAVGERYALAPAQQRSLEAFMKLSRELGRWPTLQAVADQTGVSKVTVFEHRRAMERKGAIVPVGLQVSRYQSAFRVVEA